LSKTTELDPSSKDIVELELAVNFLIKTIEPPFKLASRSSAPESKPIPLPATGVKFKLL
tara:strand:+ start:466 stop:642 length:177 start_codon:yes stop_codon:yes gene_type:complete